MKEVSKDASWEVKLFLIVYVSRVPRTNYRNYRCESEWQAGSAAQCGDVLVPNPERLSVWDSKPSPTSSPLIDPL